MWARLAANSCSGSSVTENYAELVVDGHHILPALLADIEAAERVIHVSIFLFFRDPIGEEVAEALARKARAGLDERVLLNVEKTGMGDPFSTGEKEMIEHDPNIDYDPTEVKPLCERMTAAGVRVQDTNIDYDAVAAAADARLRSIGQQIRGSIAIDDMHIDHRKLVVIDGRIGWCGGANIGAQYLFHVPFDPRKDAREEGLERKLAQLPEPWWKWHDSLTRFEGPIVLELDAEFHDRWVLDGGDDYPPLSATPSAAPARGTPVASATLHCNAPNDEPNGVRELYLRLIREAQRSIFIENPYLYQPAIVDALCAAKRARPDLSAKVTEPDVLMQAHTAPLGIAFYTGAQFPADYRGDAFVAMHGSWDRTVRNGYKVVRLRMRNGTPTGEVQDFMTGFVVDDHAVWGRPVGVAVAQDGSLLVSEDGANTIWRVSAAKR